MVSYWLANLMKSLLNGCALRVEKYFWLVHIPHDATHKRDLENVIIILMCLLSPTVW